MDFASEGRTCVSDDESLDKGDEGVDGGIRGSIEKRRAHACLGEAAKMVVVPVWRNPDVSTS